MLEWDEIQDLIEELLENQGLNWMKRAKKCLACVSPMLVCERIRRTIEEHVIPLIFDDNFL